MPNPTEFSYAGITVPAGCRRIVISAELEPASDDPRIQPTGFPDVGPVLYPDPSGKHGLICIIESEPSMANRLEEVCFSNKYEGTLRAPTFAGLPYLRAEKDHAFKTASTIDGHRFASDFLAKCSGQFVPAQAQPSKLAEYIKASLGVSSDGKTMPVSRIPEVFELVMGLDTMSLIHGFQISNDQISFVGLRHPRALTASVVGYGCERVIVPGVKFNVGQVESESGQAIFQKQRITAPRIEARFSIDVALLASLRLAPPANSRAAHPIPDLQTPRLQLLIAIALWKVASFLSEFEVEKSLRTECKLKLKGNPKIGFDAGAMTAAFSYQATASASLAEEITAAQLPAGRSPLILTFAS